ncbi:MAG TPA: hypothetical protein VN639_08310, partial [Azonexus sp.]|nr:hypothetical protein [Azonexus sp.]
MPASVCQHESGRFIGPVKDKPRRYWHYRIAQFPAFQRQTAAFSADLTLELSKSQQTYGLNFGWQNTWGNVNPALYAPAPVTGSANGKPNSNSFVIEADWVPFG